MESRKLKPFTKVLLFLAVLCLGTGVFTLSAQVTTFGSVTVSVVDPSGAAVPNAQLEIKDLSTNVVRKATTGQQGTYTFPDLTFGTYSLTITANGFQSQVFSRVQVQTSRNTDMHAALKIGSANRYGQHRRCSAG